MGSDDGAKTIKKKALTSAPPPWHSVLLIVCFGLLFVALLPSMKKIDQTATMETFTKVLFPNYFTIQMIAYIRLFIALIIWTITLHMIFDKNGWKQQTSYLPGSQLIMVPNHLIGLKTCFPFTTVSWIFLGIYFSLASYITFRGIDNTSSNNNNIDNNNITIATTTTVVSPWILRIALMTWQVAAPNSLLVASVIRYVIWPGVLKKGNDTTNLKSMRNIFMHNINALFTLSEVAILGGTPVRWSDVSLAPLVGICYVIFSWNMNMSWNESKYGPQYIYFFFDTTLPGYIPSVSLIGLLIALILFFVLFCICESLLIHYIKGGIVGALSFVVILSSLVMRFRD